MWPRSAVGIGDHGDPGSVGLRWGGKVSWESDPVAAEGLVAQVRRLQSWGYPSRLISEGELKSLEPSLDALDAPAPAGGRREIHLPQCADGRLMIGKGDQESLAEDDSQAHADDLLYQAHAADLLYQACRICPDSQVRGPFRCRWAWRPMPLDGYPVMGFASETPNLYVALTHSGITLAPALSQLAAQEICDGIPADAALGTYRPQRFAGMTPEEAAAATHPRAAKMR